MKFRIIIFILILLLLTSCGLINGSSDEVQETGAWGPIVDKANDVSSVYYLSSIDHAEIKIEVEVFQTANQLFFYPLLPMVVGESYQLMAEGNPKPVVNKIDVRIPCLAYLGNPGGNSEIWKKCPGMEPSQLTKMEGKVEEISVPRSGEWIFFTLSNVSNGNEIWQVRPDGSEIKKIFDCSEAKCSEIESNPMSGKLVFIQTIQKPQIKLLDLNTGSVNVIENSGSDLKFSPDGQFLSFINNSIGELTILNLATMIRISKQSGAGLTGEWANDSLSILYGELDYWGGIPGVRVNELDIQSGKVKPLIFDPYQNLEYYQPMYTRDEGVYLTAIRQRNAGPSKQLWLLKEGNEGVKQITNDPLFHYSFPSWNSDYSELVFQRYLLNKSDAKPQVVVWNQNTDTFQVIAENAATPFWLP